MFVDKAAGGYDVCVIGGGPIGISCATELGSLGVSVLLVESGGSRFDRRIQRLSDAEIADPRRHSSMDITVARRLGGTSNLWGARCLPLDPIDFMPRPELHATRWPIAYDDLVPFLEAACRHTQSGKPVYTARLEGPHLADDTFSIDTLERWGNVQRSQAVHRKALERSANLHVLLNTTVTGLVLDVHGRVGAAEAVRKGGTLVHLRANHFVVAAGGLESTRLLLALRRRRPALFGGEPGPLGRYYMGHVTGQVADIVFADGRLDDAFDYFVDAHHSFVRRRFVASQAAMLREGLLNAALWPVVPAIADAGHRSAILSAVYLAIAYPPLGKCFVAEAIRARHAADAGDNRLLAHLLNVLRGTPEALRFLLDFSRRRYFGNTRLPGVFLKNRRHTYGLCYHAEQIPRADSRVTLTDIVDETGLPRLRIDLKYSPEDAVSVIRTHELLDGWLRRTGLGRLEWRVPEGERIGYVLETASHGTHQIGTIRMAQDRREGVVDADLRCFDVPNLFVASTAVLPTSGQANPTLMAVALAVRLAHYLKNQQPAAMPSDALADFA